MIDVLDMPVTITTREDREWFVLFSICVAGKSAKQTSKKLNRYINEVYNYNMENIKTPFDIIRLEVSMDILNFSLNMYKFGQYKRIEKAFREVIKLDVMTDLTVEKLEAIPGIGPKTARFIVLYTNPEADCVPLDTHILKYLANNYPAFDVPKSTPPKGPRYNALEDLFKWDAKRQGKSVRALDTEVWKSYAIS
jgi:3-methyladenine DNA glycosylase/8-oxoguanine DNA glycosylase